MLFNSYVFVFAFVPITLLGFFWVAKRFGSHGAVGWLVATSLLFYGWWYPPYLLLLLTSISFNYGFGFAIERACLLGRAKARMFLIAGLMGNLGLIGYFKYAGFLASNLNAVFGVRWGLDEVVLPLGISFFTFQQIAYLMDVYGGLKSERNFLTYALFVSFFPQLIAGPITHHGEIMPQFRRWATFRFSYRNLVLGLTIFCIGLFKKVAIADPLSTAVGPTFSQAANGVTPDLLQAWSAVLSYTFQIYFDFSGYSDMAIGLSRLFGIRLPINFDSPYKSINIIEFWRRWHMTLSRFLRDYLYIPMGGNRLGRARRHINLMTTMVLGGLWHGADWSFLLWGLLHGTYLIVNHAWMSVFRSTEIPPVRGVQVLAWGVTFLAVVVAWVPFRADSIAAAGVMWQGMLGMGGVALPSSMEWRIGELAPLLSGWGVEFLPMNSYEWLWGWTRVVLAVGVTFALPNTNEVFHHWYSTTRPNSYAIISAERLRWRPSVGWSAVAAFVGAWAILKLASPSEFIYYNF